MAGDEQERFEDYQELERYIEDLQAGRPTRLPQNLTPEQARVYRMAAVFHSAASEVAEPRPAFIVDLYARLRAQVAEQTAAQSEDYRPVPRPETSALNGLAFPVPEQQPTLRLTDDQAHQAGKAAPADQLAPSPADVDTQKADAQSSDNDPVPLADAGRGNKKGKKRIVSRRAFFAGGAVAAASLAAGVGGGMVIANRMASTPTQWPKLVGTTSVDWHYVTTVAELGANAIKFVTDSVIGYIIHGDDHDEIIALSAACTHMGCIVQWNKQARRFDCPCHNGRFTAYGEPDPTSPLKYLRALPRLETRVEDGKIYVAVPAARK